MSEKIYSQDDFDNIVSKAKENIENKLKKNYVEKSEYERLSNEYITLRNNVRSKEIKEYYISNGGRDAYFNDFMELNKDLFETQDLKESFKEKTKKHSWAFMNDNIQKEDNSKEDNQEFDLYDYSSYK